MFPASASIGIRVYTKRLLASPCPNRIHQVPWEKLPRSKNRPSRLIPGNNMRVLGLASYPVEAAATRYRLEQFAEPLANRGIELRIKPFLDSALFASLYRRDRILRTVPGLMKAAGNRMRDIVASRGFDVLLVQGE